MKKFIAKSIIFMMVAFVSQAVNAQNIVTNISTNDFQSCKAYLAEHPTDTIKNGNVRVFVANGTIVRTGATVAPVVPSTTKVVRQEAQSVHRDGNTTQVEYKNGASTSFTRTKSDQVSYADKVAVVNGEKRAIKPGHKDWNGDLRHRLYVGLGGGVDYMPKPHSWAPMVAIEGGYETCHFLVGLQAEGTRAHYTQTAEYHGAYNTMAIYAFGGYKFWQDNLCKNYAAAVAYGGYAYHKTDGEEAEASSKNWGFGAKLGIRAKVALLSHLGLTLEAGGVLQPWVEHSETQKHQNLGNIGGYLEIGGQYKF